MRDANGMPMRREYATARSCRSGERRQVKAMANHAMVSIWYQPGIFPPLLVKGGDSLRLSTKGTERCHNLNVRPPFGAVKRFGQVALGNPCARAARVTQRPCPACGQLQKVFTGMNTLLFTPVNTLSVHPREQNKV